MNAMAASALTATMVSVLFMVVSKGGPTDTTALGLGITGMSVVMLAVLGPQNWLRK